MPENVKAIWKRADCVCFDVDSTVIVDEGIDELAAFVGKGEEVAKITVGAMQGKGSYRSALKARLDIMHPSRAQIAKFIESHPPRFTPNIKELINALLQRNIPIYLVTGGFQCLLEPVATELNIPAKNIFSNKLMFYYNGDYAGFDERLPTSNDGGKAAVIKHLKELHGYHRLVHIGDGVTDLEACPPADAFIGFGGNQIRDKVRREAQWFVTDFAELIKELP